MTGLETLIVFALFLIFAITALNAFAGPFLKKAPLPTSLPSVSVLIPARNESASIGDCLDSVCGFDYPGLEILVLDDDSTDNTGDIIAEKAGRDPRIKQLPGAPLPEGWTGKNWACHQLSNAASGEVLVFTDADNTHDPAAIKLSLGLMERHGLDLLSAFPSQDNVSLAERLIIPSVYMLVFSFLPLWLTRYLPFSALAAANGQWLVWRRSAYDRVGGHEAVRSDSVEDTSLARRVKELGMKLLTVSGDGIVGGRMYHTFLEIWHGFQKNLYGISGYNPWVLGFLLVLMFFLFVYPYILLLSGVFSLFVFLAIALNVFTRVILFRYLGGSSVNIYLSPVSFLLLIAMGANSFMGYRRGQYVWKGRKLNVG